jgi:uncharacterized protein YqeY
MALLEQLSKDMVVSMKNKDSFSLGVIRMAKGAIQLEAINKKKELTDEEIVAVLSKQIKIRNDSISEFTKANRMDLVEQNKKEIEILNKYMPEQLSEEEINKVIDEIFEEVKPSSIKDMGKVMGLANQKLKGKADMGIVSSIIKEKLNNL